MVHTLNPSIRKAEAGGIAEDEAGLVLQCYLLTKRKQADLYQNLKTSRHSEWPLMSVLTKQRQGTSLWAPGQAGAYSETPPPNKQTLCRGSADTGWAVTVVEKQLNAYFRQTFPSMLELIQAARQLLSLKQGLKTTCLFFFWKHSSSGFEIRPQIVSGSSLRRARLTYS